MRFLLFGAALFLSMLMFTLFASLSGMIKEPDLFGFWYMILMSVALLGTFICYFSSKIYMKWSLDLHQLDVTESDKIDEINYHVKRIALSANIRPPELYFFDNEKPNVVMLGTNPNKSILAFSTGMLEKFDVSEISGSVAPLVAGATKGSLKTKILLISLMNSFGLGFAQWLNDRLKDTKFKMLGNIIYWVVFVITLLMFNLPTYLILRAYSRSSTFNNDLVASEITSTQEIISGLARIGTRDCDIGLTEKYISFVGEQKDKDNVLNPFGTIPLRIDTLVKENNRRVMLK